jgi:hypothetical protein
MLLSYVLGLIAFGRPDNFVISPKVYANKFKRTYQTFGTMTNPAAETESIRLQADTQLAAFFCIPFIKYTLTIKLPSYYRDYYVIRLGLIAFVSPDNLIISP